MSKVLIVYGMKDELTGKRKSFDLARDLPALLEAARGIEDLALIMIDPLVVIAKTDSHKNAETRRDLQPLVSLAEKLGP